MTTYLTLALLLLYGAFLSAVGLWVGRRVRGAEDFYVAGRRLGPGVLGATVLAANIGAGSTVGATGLAYSIGASAWWWVGSAAIGTFVLARWFGPRMWEEARRLGCYTVGDYLESRYRSGVRGVSMTILWLASLAILAAQLVAMGAVLQAAVGLPAWIGTVLGAAVVLIYYSARRAVFEQLRQRRRAGREADRLSGSASCDRKYRRRHVRRRGGARRHGAERHRLPFADRHRLARYSRLRRRARAVVRNLAGPLTKSVRCPRRCHRPPRAHRVGPGAAGLRLGSNRPGNPGTGTMGRYRGPSERSAAFCWSSFYPPGSGS